MPQHAPAAEDASDAELLERVRGGTPAALRPLYERHGGMVYRFALLWSGSPAIAADVTQDMFVHLLTHAADFDPVRARLRACLCGIARNFVRRIHALPAHDPYPMTTMRRHRLRPQHTLRSSNCCVIESWKSCVGPFDCCLRPIARH